LPWKSTLQDNTNIHSMVCFGRILILFIILKFRITKFTFGTYPDVWVTNMNFLIFPFPISLLLIMTDIMMFGKSVEFRNIRMLKSKFSTVTESYFSIEKSVYNHSFGTENI